MTRLDLEILGVKKSPLIDLVKKSNHRRNDNDKNMKHCKQNQKARHVMLPHDISVWKGTETTDFES